MIVLRISQAIRMAAGLCLLAAIATVAATPALAADRFETRLAVGWSGHSKSGAWTPVRVTVRNSGSDFRGTLEIHADASGSFGGFTNKGGSFGGGSSVGISGGLIAPGGKCCFSGGPMGAVTHHLEVVIPGGATKTFTVYTLAGSGSFTAGLTGAGDTSGASSQVSVTVGTEPLVGVVSDDPGALDFAGALRLGTGNGQGSVQVAHVKTADLPESSLALTTFDVLAFTDATTDSLSAAQRTSVLDYVNGGGVLLVTAGSSWRRTVAGLPAELLPVSVSGSHQVSNLGPLAAELETAPPQGPVELADLVRKDGVVSLDNGDGQPVVVVAKRGSGRVVVSALTFGSEPLQSWAGSRNLLRGVLVQGGAGTVPTTAPAGGFSNGISQFSQLLSDVPSLALPSLPLVGGILLAYVVLVGPANYLLLRRLRRRDLAWVTIPLVVLVFTGGAYTAGARTKGSDVVVNRVRLLTLLGDTGRADVQTYAGIFAPHRGTYSVLTGGHPLVGGGQADQFNNGQQASSGITVEDGAVPRIETAAQAAYAMRSFSTEEIVAVPGTLSVAAHLSGSRITGTFTNRFADTSLDVVAVNGVNFQAIGTVAPGSGADISLSASAGTFSGQPIGEQVYHLACPPDCGGYPSGDSRTRDLRKKAQVLDTLAGKGFSQPLLVAFYSEPGGLTVSGEQPRVSDLSVVLLPLSLDETAGTSLLVDGSGGALRLGDVVTLNQNSFATFELAPPAGLTGPLRVSTTPGSSVAFSGAPPCYNPSLHLVPVPGTVSPVQPNFNGNCSALAGIDVFVGGHWVALSLTRNGELYSGDLPAGSMSSFGTVRVRVRSGATGVTFGRPLLSGGQAG
ncbi:MAG: hypothetical protein ACYDGR_02115 [Candidatus Dormibacteria bacterium]